ncbi:MAG: sigma-54-dependent Fis family transcriptional regulator [Deltaproteobacteria bacterium]|nr:sigma-54-dependent Fis family transcriptional regulator [Deltaproteobacteria bacterium]
MDAPSILVVDDENLIRWSVSEHFSRRGFAVTSASSGEEGLERVARDRVDALVLDVKLPGIDGVAALRQALRIQPDLAVVMISAHSTVDLAVEAMKLGAIDFVVKPFSLQALDAAVGRALSTMEARREILRLSADPKPNGAGASTIVGRSPAVDEVRRMVSRCAAAESATVLIEGESGVGKEVVARAIHAESTRASFPMLHINCAALPEQLIESELFGHERGAFTGAHTQKRGIVESADGGTVFLDEAGELQLPAQAKLLQLLEARTFRRVGGVAEARSNVRVIAATNRNLIERVSEGHFRSDLYYRLNVVRIRVPPVRERVEDIPLLVAHFVARLNRETGHDVLRISQRALDALVSYPWPGNVREIRNVVERALILSPGVEELRFEDLPPEIKDGGPIGPVVRAPKPVAGSPADFPELEAAERQLILQALERTSHNQSAAARLLGISRDTLRYRMKRHGIAL